MLLGATEGPPGARAKRDERGISHHQNNIMTLPAKMDQVVVVERKPEDATATTTEPVTPVSRAACTAESLCAATKIGLETSPSPATLVH